MAAERDQRTQIEALDVRIRDLEGTLGAGPDETALAGEYDALAAALENERRSLIAREVELEDQLARQRAQSRKRAERTFTLDEVLSWNTLFAALTRLLGLATAGAFGWLLFQLIAPSLPTGRGWVIPLAVATLLLFALLRPFRSPFQ